MPARAGIDRLQRTLGNRGMHHLLCSGAIQAKLAVGPADDEYEREADRVADDVMRMPDPTASLAAQRVPLKIQRVCPDCEDELQRRPSVTVRRAPVQISRKCPECEKNLHQEMGKEGTPPEEEETVVQAKRAPGDPPEASSSLESYLASSRGGGQPLAASTRAYFEPRFGHDFGHVRVHTDSRADQASGEISARAFTTGADVYFAQGQYNPGTDHGDRLLGHELTHVLQQSAAAPLATHSGHPLPFRMAGGTLQSGPQSLQAPVVQRAENGSGGGAEGMCPPLPDPDGDWAKEKWLCEMRQEPWGSNARLLAPGAKGRSVELLHQAMHHWLCWISPTNIPEHTLPDPESDLYTEATGLVVKDFQKFSHAVMQEGIVGPETISLLDGYVGGPDIPPADCGIPEPKRDPGCGPECYDQSGKALPEAELPETCNLLCPHRPPPPRELPFVYSRLLQVGGMFANHAYVDVPRINKRYTVIEPFCSWWDGEEWQQPGIYNKLYGGVPAQKYDNSPDPCGQPARRSKCEPYDSAEETEQCLEAKFQAYPSPSYYEAVSGPNSNTFAKWLAWNCCKNFEAFYDKPPAHFHTLPGWGNDPAQAWSGDTACPSKPTCGE